MLVTVDVTQENIDNCDRASHTTRCPIALALKDIIRREVNVQVGPSSLTVGTTTWDFDGQIPYQLNDKHEDHEEFTIEDLEPFSFRTNIPANYFKDNYDEDLDDEDLADENQNDEVTPSRFNSYTVSFMKANTPGEYLVRDSHGDTVILTVAQIEKLYNESRPYQSRVWTSL